MMHAISSKNIIIFAVFLFLILFITGCRNSDEANSAEPSRVNQPKKVTITRVELRDFQYSVQANGTLIARHHTKLNALVDGQIENIPVDLGDTIRKGQLLFRIRTVDYELAYRQAEANIARAEVILKDRKREKNRMQNLFNAGSATQQTWDQAVTAYEEADAALVQARVARDIARQYLTDCTVKAPYDGVLTARFFEQGEYAKKGSTIVEIMDLTVLNAELGIPERYAGKISRGLPVTLSVNSGSDPVQGEIVAVNPKIDQSTRTFLIKVTVDNQDGKLQSGLFCSALFQLPPQRAQTAIPSAALSRDEGRSAVWIVKDGKAFKKLVRTGDSTDGWIRILDGLEPGDTVVTEGAGGLLDGVPVMVANQPS
jgi:membrane fusion protein (multidrug efflux system)